MACPRFAVGMWVRVEVHDLVLTVPVAMRPKRAGDQDLRRPRRPTPRPIFAPISEGPEAEAGGAVSKAEIEVICKLASIHRDLCQGGSGAG